MTSCDHRKQNNHHRTAVRSVGLFKKLCAIAERDLLGDFYYFWGVCGGFVGDSLDDHFVHFDGCNEILGELQRIFQIFFPQT